MTGGFYTTSSEQSLSAGMLLGDAGSNLPHVEKQLRELLYESLVTSQRQVVLNFGPFGSGKTRAAKFFCSRERLLSMISSATVPHVREVYALYVSLPRHPEHAGRAILGSIINAIGFDNLRKVIRDLIAERGQEQALHLIQESGAGEALGKAIWLMGLEPKNGELVTFQGEPPRSTHSNLLKSYFLSGATRSRLKKMGLSREISSDNDRSRVLVSLFSCLIGFAPVEQVEQHARVVLWMDDINNAIFYRSVQWNPIRAMIENLIWCLPHYFTVIMNVSTLRNGDVEILLGRPLGDWFSHRIHFEPVSLSTDLYFPLTC